MYDKGIEEKSAPRAMVWRVEVEAKYQLARRLWEDFKSTSDPTTWSYMQCEAQWRLGGFYWPLPNSAELREIGAGSARPRASAERLMKWLGDSVAPTIPRLLQVYSVEQILACLQLDVHAMPRPGMNRHE